MDIDIAFGDQLSAEYGEAERLVPIGRNRSLWSRVRGLGACRAFDIEEFPENTTVPIQRYNGWSSAAHRREHDRPATTSAAVEYCSLCHTAMASLTPFWVNAGTVIVQIDLCRTCTIYAIDDLDAEPQIPFADLLNLPA